MADTEIISTNLSPWDEGYNESEDNTPCYGHPASPDIILSHFGSDCSDVQIYALIHFDQYQGQIKPKRGTPEALATEFFSSIVQAGDRFFFSGMLNKWPGLNLLELKTVEVFTKKPATPELYVSKEAKTRIIWSNTRSNAKNTAKNMPVFPGNAGGKAVELVRVTLHLPKYTDFGYSLNNPGYLWYYAANEAEPKVSHGVNAILAAKEAQFADSKATMAYHFGHRYAKLQETRRDKMTYHTGVVVEWEHGEFITLFELAWRNGIGGYNGKSNWVADKLEKPSSKLFKLMPACMKLPWVSSRSEIRVIDLPLKSFVNFEEYLQQYNSPTERFLDPKIKESSKILISPRTKADLIKYCANRIIADDEYSEPSVKKRSLGYNCQTFAASFYGFLVNANVPAFSFPSVFGMFSRGAVMKNFYKRKDMFTVRYLDKKKELIEYEESDVKGKDKGRNTNGA